MAVTVEELVVTLSARMDQYQFQLSGAQRDTDRRLDAIERRFDSTTARLRTSASGLAMSIKGALGGIAGAFGAASLLSYADAWTRVTRALDGAQTTFGIVLAGGEQVARMAVETRSSMEELSKLYIRTAAAAAKLGLDTAVAADVTTTFAKALKLGQATTAEQTSALGQFSQALQKGKLDGDEFRTIMESAGVVQQALIDKFKVSGATLIKMAADGKITAKDMILALQQVKPQVDEAFGKSAATVSEAWENLRTAMSVTLGQYNQATGVTRGLTDAIQGLANNIDSLIRALVVIGTVSAVAFGPTLIIRLAQLAATAMTAARGGTTLESAMIGLTAALVGGVYTTSLFGSKLTLIEREGITARDVLVALHREAGEALSAAFAKAAAAVQALFDTIRNAMSGGGSGSSGDMGAFFRASLNGVIGAFNGAANIIAGSLLTVFGALPSAIVDTLNAGLGYVEAFAKNVAGVLNNLPSVSINVDAINVGRLANSYADLANKAKDHWAAASRAMSRDYVGEMGQAARDVGDAVLASAAKVARERQWKGTIVKPPPTPKPVYTDQDGNTKKYETAIAKVKEHTEALIAEAGAVGKSVAEKERAAAVHELLTEARKAEIKITPQLLAQMDELARAYGSAKAQLEMLQGLQRVKDDTTALRQETDLVGLYGFELFKARTELELLNEAKKSGVPLTETLRAEIAQTAAANAAMRQLSDSLNAVRDTSRSALSGFINDLRAGKSGAEALSGALGKIADRLVDMAANQLVDAALGSLLKGAGGSGGVLSIFGFAGGGVMTQNGPQPLNRFAGGGVSRTAAIFGEAGPEAAVPLPDGRRIPVELRMPDISGAAARVQPAAASQAINVTVAPVFHVGGKVSADDLAALETRVAKAIPNVAKSAVSQALERQPGFGRRGV